METLFDLSKPVAIGCDHAGFEMKELIVSFIEGKDLNFKDYRIFCAIHSPLITVANINFAFSPVAKRAMR